MSDKIQIQDESGDRKYFTVIPNYVLNHSTIYDREVYIQMKRIAGESGEVWMSQTKLAKQCGISKPRIIKALRYLCEHQWIEKVGKKKTSPVDSQGTDVYKIVDLWDLNNNFYRKSQGVGKKIDRQVGKQLGGGRSKSCTGVGKNPAHKEEPVKKNQEEDNVKILLSADNNILQADACDDTKEINSQITEIITLFRDNVNPNINYGNKTFRKATKQMIDKYGFQELKRGVEASIAVQGQPYAPVITTPYQFQLKMGELKIYFDKEKNKTNKFGSI
ncbi:MAG: helix-turn-helix domain-containing protein [Patescibacteria group bacterium]